MNFDVLKKFAALLSVICVSFAAVGCAPPAEEPSGGDAPAAEEAPAEEEPAEEESGSATE